MKDQPCPELLILKRDWMRSFLYVAILMSSALRLTARQAAAESLAQPRTWTVTLFLCTSAGISDPARGNSIGLGVALAYDWTPNLGFEGEFSHLLDVAGDTAAVGWSISNFSASGVYHFDVLHVTPYATFGLGFERSNYDLKGHTIADVSLREELLALGLVPDSPGFDSSSTKVAFSLGGGVKYAINDRMVARADLRRFQAVDIARITGGFTAGLRSSSR